MTADNHSSSDRDGDSSETASGRSGNEDSRDFVREIIDRDLEAGTYDTVITRFPPEPNGYPHIGHAKSIVLNFELAREYGGRCHLRFDDTNPETESQEYVESIKDAVKWLGYDWGEHLYFASDYFEQFYEFAVQLIRQGDAYVDSLDQETIREYRGSINQPGKPSPHRDRSIEENLDLFRAMREGEFEEGEHVLRARIDMSSSHMIMRDPVLYRILYEEHYRHGDDWCIYPMYDFAHPLEDAIENITHSLCSLEFDTRRELYNWVLEHCLPEEELETRPHQYEFSRLNLGYTVMSKSKLRKLIEENRVEGWDDPRLPTIKGLQRRGVPPDAVRRFIQDLGITRTQGRVEISRFEHELRDTLETQAPRVMGITDPLKVVIENYPEEETEWLRAPYWPRNVDREAYREVPFTRVLFIDRDDFRDDPPDGFIRLAPGREVRLRFGYFITCTDVLRGEDGEIQELRCRYDPETKGGQAPDGRSPEGTLHWVSADYAIPMEVRSCDRLFRVPAPDEQDEPFDAFLNPDSLQKTDGFIEPSVTEDPPDRRYQFERVGYFWQDPVDSAPEDLVFNQIVPLRDTWSDEESRDMEKKKQEKRREKERHRQRSMEGQTDPAEKLSDEQQEVFLRYIEDFHLDREDAAVIAGDKELTRFFEDAIETHNRPESVASRIVNDLMRVQKDVPLEELSVSPGQFAEYVSLIDREILSTAAADEVFEEMVETGTDPEDIVDNRGLRQVEQEDELEPIVRDVLDDHPEQVQEFQEGNENVIDYFMGKVMQETNGSAHPETTRNLLREHLEE